MVTPCAINYGRDVNDLVLGSSNDQPPSTPYNWQRQGYQRLFLKPFGRTSSVRFWIEYLPDIDAPH